MSNTIKVTYTGFPNSMTVGTSLFYPYWDEEKINMAEQTTCAVTLGNCGIIGITNLSMLGGSSNMIPEWNSKENFVKWCKVALSNKTCLTSVYDEEGYDPESQKTLVADWLKAGGWVKIATHKGNHGDYKMALWLRGKSGVQNAIG